jgi:O-antigen ligase
VGNDSAPIVLSTPTMAANRVGVTSFLRKGLYLLLLAVPFHSVLVLPGVSVVKAMGLLLAPVWLLWLVIKLGNSHWPWVMPRQNLRIVLTLAVFIASILLSALYDSPSPIFLTSLTTLILDSGMAIFIWTLVPSEAVLRRACASLAVGGTILGLLVIFQFVAPQEVSRILGARIFLETIGGTTTVRATGPFRDPNYGALTLIVLACLSFYLAITCRKRWQRTLLLLSVAVQVGAVLLTFSRAGYITLALASSTILWRERYQLRLWKVALVATIGLVLFATFGSGVFDKVSARARSIVEFAQLLGEQPSQARQFDLSLWYRFQLVPIGIRMAFDRFPLGVGWENFRYQVTQYSADLPRQGSGAHNTYITVAAELGLPGLIASAWLLWSLWVSTGYLCKNAQGKAGLLVRGTRYGLLVVLIGGLSLTVLHEAVLWVLIGLIMTQNQLVLKKSKRGGLLTLQKPP